MSTIDQLYDGQRELHYRKPLLRGWLHLIWFILCLVLGPVTIMAEHNVTQRLALGIYLATVCALFGTSALYHRGRWSALTMSKLQRLDHAMIFFLIAGTATPELLLAWPGLLGLSALIVMWTVTLTVVHLCWMDAPERLVGAAFLGLGWLAGLALPAVWLRFGVSPVALIVIGGALYTIGALSYHSRRPDPLPMIFGYHEVFHAFVCAAAACQFVAIAVFIV